MTTPTTIGRYEIKEKLGAGGMASVFLARDPRFERDVAVKVLPHAFLHDPSFRQRFEREAKTIAALEHKAIVPVYDYGEHEGQPYLVMRHMAGGSLIDRLRQGPMSLEEAAEIIGRIASALDKAHEAGIVHRDLKPGNILFDQDGDAYLSDFGIAKLLEQSGTLTGTGLIGTPAYMSPEQAKGEQNLDGRSDIYALGAIAFEMLTGKLPYHADTPMGVAVKHIMEPVPRILDSNPNLPAGVEEIIGRSMAKERSERYQTPQQLAQDMHQTAHSAPRPTAAATGQPAVEPQSAPTVLAETAVAPSSVDETVVANYDETIADIKADIDAPVTAQSEKQAQRPAWLWGVVAVVILGLLFFGGRAILSGSDSEPTTETAEQPIAEIESDTEPAAAEEANSEETTSIQEENIPTAEPTQSRLASAAIIEDTNRYYYLQTKFLEPENKCLESNSQEREFLGGASFMDDCQNVTGQFWKIIPTEDEGYYRLQSMWLEDQNQCFEGGFGVDNAGVSTGAYMDDCQNVTGQFWKFVEAEEGYYQMQTMFLEEDNKCLEGNRLAEGAVLDGAAFMNDCQLATGQLWKLVPIP